MKTLTTALKLVFAIGVMALASQARGQATPINHTLPDGSEITIIWQGDRWQGRIFTLDDFTLLFNDDHFLEYAVLNEHGDMVRSGVRAHNSDERSQEELNFLSNVPTGLRHSEHQINLFRAHEEIMLNAFQEFEAGQQGALRVVEPKSGWNRQAFRGSFLEIPFILVEFPDRPFTRSVADHEQLFNYIGLTMTPDGPVPGSLRDYFRSTSFGAFDLKVNVYGPFMMPYPASTYHFTPRQFGGTGDMGPPVRMVQEALRQATDESRGDQRLDLRRYVFNTDGVSAHHIHFIPTGYAPGQGGVVGQTIWPHAGMTTGSFFTKDGVFVRGYSTSNEFKHIRYGETLGAIGPIAHELGHSLFNLPDVYGVPGNLRNWCVMGTGDEGNSPSHFSAWSRYRIGWVTPIVLDEPQIVTLPDPSTHGKDVVFRINTATPNEFFLIENRQQVGFDQNVHSSGMVIYHVDDATTGCIMCNPDRRRVFVKQPFGGLHSLSSTRDMDTWPQFGRTRFTDYTVPNSRSWAGEPTNKPIVNITQEDRVVTFRFMMDPILPTHFDVRPTLVAPTFVHGSSNREIGVRLENWARPITEATIEWSIDGQPQQTHQWSGDLESESEIHISLGSFYFTNDTYEISVRIKIPEADVDSIMNQTTVVTRPIFFEDFEGDVSGWQLVNGETVNQWMIGSNVSSGGNMSAYISDDSISHQHNENVPTQWIHLYHEVSFPPSDEDFDLYFDVIGTGELAVILMGTYFRPTAGIRLNIADMTRITGHVSPIEDIQHWETMHFTIPAERHAGRAGWLLFTWESGVGQPPKAIDNIAIVGPASEPHFLTAATLPPATIDMEYSLALRVPGTLPVTLELIYGELPAGLTFSPAGVISGIPTTGGTSTFTVRASNNYGSPSREFTLVVRIPPTITTDTLPSGKIGEFYSQTFTATGTTPIRWNHTGGSLPRGLTLAFGASGVLSGTPTETGTSTFTITATNDASQYHREFTIVIADTTETSILDLEKHSTLTIHPNPVSDMLYIQSEIPIVRVEIFNLQGQLLRQINEQISELSVANLSAGTYILKVTTAIGVATQRFVRK